MKKQTIAVVGGVLLSLAGIQSAKAFDAGIHYNERQADYNQQYKAWATKMERHADVILHAARRADHRRDAALKHAWKAYRAERDLSRKTEQARSAGYGYEEYAPQAYAQPYGRVAVERMGEFK